MTRFAGWSTGHPARVLHLVAINGFVGAMVGLERTILPLLAEAEYGIASRAAAIAFIATFGIAKATTNLFAGAISERFGRKPLLILGWLVGAPVPLILAWAPSWSWIIVANILLGVNQALTWSMTVVMKVDLAPPNRFGLVIGWNEFAGYAGMALTAALTGLIAGEVGLGPEPFYLGAALVLVGLLLSLGVAETRPPAAARAPAGVLKALTRVAGRLTWSDPPLAAASLSGLATNFKDGVLWGLLPILLASRGVGIEQVGLIVGLYPLVWAVSQLVFGPLSDRVGQQVLIGAGLCVQAAGVALFATDGTVALFFLASTLVGLGTGMVYPTLLAFVAARSDVEWRASALGVYRFWRDFGYVVGALGGGLAADALGLPPAFAVAAALPLFTAVVFAFASRTR